MLPPAPPSITPVGANPRVTPTSPMTLRSRPTPPARLTDEPETAVNVLVLLMPIETPPLIVPALAKLLPVPAVPDAWKPTRPLMVPVLTKFTWPPPYAATTGISEGIRVTPAMAAPPIEPSLRILLTPPVPFWTASAMPVRPERLTPSNPDVPFITPVDVLVTLTVLAALLPTTVPEESRLNRPSRLGSIVPELLSVVLLPVSVMAVPPMPSNTPVLPPDCTFTVRLLALVE